MCQLCNVYSGPLPATKTHRRRAWAFLPDLTGEHLGTLTVEQSAEIDSYRIEEDTSEPFPGRAFLLAKLGDAGDVYRVIVTGPGRAACSGEWCGRGPACKHRSAVLAALTAEALPAG